MIRLSDLRCHVCDSADVVCISPGSPAQISEASDIMTDRGESVRGLCLRCWLPARGYQQTLFWEG